MKLQFLMALLLGLSLMACNKDTDDRTDEEKILDYLAENNIMADRHESGLYYTIEVPGSEERPTVNDSVTVRYKGSLLNGDVFNETPGTATVTFPLTNLIPAWRIGVPLIGRGGKITLYCPSNLAYGNQAVGSIPAGSVLIFEVELVDFTPIDMRTDEEKILDYLDENDLSADRHESGLYYTIEEPGSEERPMLSDSVTVRYKGMLLSGQVFDQTQGTNTVTFPLSNLIPAWRIGIPLIGRGGSITLYSPSDLAYGNQAVGDIPPGSVLIFEVDLVDFN